MINAVQCGFCKHYWAGKESCDAFPDGIPVEILNNSRDHRLPYPGDHNIRMELKPGVPEAMLGELLSAEQKAA